MIEASIFLMGYSTVANGIMYHHKKRCNIHTVYHKHPQLYAFRTCGSSNKLLSFWSGQFGTIHCRFRKIPTTLKFNDETDDFEFLDIELSFDLKIINEKLILDTYFLF
jgi:hypothetical protein